MRYTVVIDYADGRPSKWHSSMLEWQMLSNTLFLRGSNIEILIPMTDNVINVAITKDE